MNDGEGRPAAIHSHRSGAALVEPRRRHHAARSLLVTVAGLAAVPVTTALAIIVSRPDRPPDEPGPTPPPTPPSWEDFAPDP